MGAWQGTGGCGVFPCPADLPDGKKKNERRCPFTIHAKGAAMFKRILVAFKFSPGGRCALQKAIALTHIHGAALHIFHALDYHLTRESADSPKLSQVRDAVRQRFEAEIKPLLAELPDVRFECEPADPALAVCRRARDDAMDLIVLGCHHRPERASMGRVDYVGMTILEKASCPVLLVPYWEQG
jgi:nucleotide-binding universal stress UspA family protein